MPFGYCTLRIGSLLRMTGGRPRQESLSEQSRCLRIVCLQPANSIDTASQTPIKNGGAIPAAPALLFRPRLAEQRHRLLQRRHDAPDQGNADVQPEHDQGDWIGALVRLIHFVLLSVQGQRAPADCMAASRGKTPSKSSSSSWRMWCFSCTARMSRLQKKPRTRRPAMMYMVTV